MSRLALFLVVASLSVVLAQQAAPKVTVNLDLPPRQRWAVLAPFAPAFGPITAWLNKTIPAEVRKVVDPLVARVDDWLPQPYADELRGVADLCAQYGVGIDLGEIVLLNLIYDLSAGCTSLVAQNSLGQILHARNLDYDIPGLRNITVQVDFQRGGRTVYTTTTFAGYIGALSGMRPGAFSITVDERDRDGGGGPLENIIEGLLKGGRQIGFTVRDVLENNATFQDAMGTLQHTRLMAPVYLIVAGANPGEAAVITRDREDPKDVWQITPPSLWWVGVTNYDHWLPSGDNRWATAQAGMNAMSQRNVTLSGMFQVISTKPVLNRSTQYSILLNPAAGSYQSFVRWDAAASGVSDGRVFGKNSQWLHPQP